MAKNFIVKLNCFLLVLGFAALLSKCGKAPAPTPAAEKKWIVSTVAGSGTAGFADGDTTQAQFRNMLCIVTDNNGNLFVADNVSLRQITYKGHVTTYINGSVAGLNPPFGNILGIVKDSHGNLFTAEQFVFIRKIISSTNTFVFAGTQLWGFKDGVGTAAEFGWAADMAIDKQDNIFLMDYDFRNNIYLRKITPAGVVSTLPLQDNTAFSSNGPPNNQCPIAVDVSGNIYVTGNVNSLIKKITPTGDVTILAGTGSTGFTD